jgi:hypothetical protein
VSSESTMKSKCRRECESCSSACHVCDFSPSNSKDSNVNIVNFCKLKDAAIEQKLNVTEEAKEMYKQFLSENLSHERKLREKK